MAIALPMGPRWLLRVTPVGSIDTLLRRLLDLADGDAVAFGVDFPIGLPRDYVIRHVTGHHAFPEFLKSLANRPGFFEVAESIEEVAAGRPFYPRRARRGMTRMAHALALGLDGPASLSRFCDRATAERPAGAPLFWTLGANQSGKAAISAWRDMLLPGFEADLPIAIWPFAGPFLDLLQPGVVAIAETYPADAMVQIGLRRIGSKRRQVDRMALMPSLRGIMDRLGVMPDPTLDSAIAQGFGADAAGEDRFDCVLGVLCVLSVTAGLRPDVPPPDPWLHKWEGWVLGQGCPAQPP